MFRICKNIRPVVFKFGVADIEIAVDAFDTIAFVVPEVAAVEGEVVVVEADESGAGVAVVEDHVHKGGFRSARLFPEENSVFPEVFQLHVLVVEMCFEQIFSVDEIRMENPGGGSAAAVQDKALHAVMEHAVDADHVAVFFSGVTENGGTAMTVETVSKKTFFTRFLLLLNAEFLLDEIGAGRKIKNVAVFQFQKEFLKGFCVVGFPVALDSMLFDVDPVTARNPVQFRQRDCGKKRRSEKCGTEYHEFFHIESFLNGCFVRNGYCGMARQFVLRNGSNFVRTCLMFPVCPSA